jgi:hypothetical protein
MRHVLLTMFLLCSATNINAAPQKKWCAEDGTVIIQTDATTFVFNGEPIDVGQYEGEGTITSFGFDGKLFLPCNK